MLWLLLGPMRPPLLMFSVSLPVVKVMLIAEPLMLMEFTMQPPFGTAVVAVRRTFVTDVQSASEFVWSYWAAPTWFSGARPRPGM